MAQDLAAKLRALLEKNNRRMEATAARAELSRDIGRLISAHEFEAAVDVLKAAKSKAEALSDQKTRYKRWLSLYVRKDEKGLYPSVKEYLQSWLVKEEHGLQGVKAAHVIETSSAGDDGRPRPDMLAWIVSSDAFSRRIDFVSFEVKPSGASAMNSAAQTASQKNFVSFAYLVQQVSSRERDGAFVVDLQNSCKGYGVGLILMIGDVEVADFDFEIALRPERNPTPQDAWQFFEARVDASMLNLAQRAMGHEG